MLGSYLYIDFFTSHQNLNLFAFPPLLFNLTLCTTINIVVGLAMEHELFEDVEQGHILCGDLRSDTLSLLPSASSPILLSSNSSPSNENLNSNAHPILRQSWEAPSISIFRLPGLFWRLLAPIFVALIPSFLRRHRPQLPPRKLHPTSYLDGLRGIAALIVFIDHFIVHWFESLKFGYLSAPEHSHIIQFPIIRLLYSGRASVGIFFVVSGFVLSHKSLKLIHAGDNSTLAGVLASSTLRRGMRLYLPIMAGTFISAVLSFQGYYMDVPSRSEMIPPRFPTFSEQAWHWWDTMSEITFPFRDPAPNAPYSPPYNGHLWTIPIEFYGSIVVFGLVLAVSQVGVICRRGMIAWLACWSLCRQRWDLFLFLSGTLLSDFSLSESHTPVLADKEQQTDIPFAHNIPKEHAREGTFLKQLSVVNVQPVRVLGKVAFLFFRETKGVLNVGLMFLSLFLLSYSGDGENAGKYYEGLQNWTPPSYQPLWYGYERFWVSIGSVIFVFCLGNSRICQKVFETGFAQYLGDVSYSLYIIHGLVVFTLGTNLMERWTGAVGKETLNALGQRIVVTSWQASQEQYWKAFLVSVVPITLLVFWGADLFWRFIDRNAVKTARVVENWMGPERKG